MNQFFTNQVCWKVGGSWTKAVRWWGQANQESKVCVQYVHSGVVHRRILIDAALLLIQTRSCPSRNKTGCLVMSHELATVPWWQIALHKGWCFVIWMSSALSVFVLTVSDPSPYRANGSTCVDHYIQNIFTVHMHTHRHTRKKSDKTSTLNYYLYSPFFFFSALPPPLPLQ